MSDQQREWQEHQTRQLAQRRCPHSGEPLELVRDAWGMDSLMCEVCDCFGYAPNDPRIGPATTTP